MAVAGFTGEEGGTAPSPRLLLSLSRSIEDAADLWRAVFLQGLVRALDMNRNEPGDALPNVEDLLELTQNISESETLFKRFNHVLEATGRRIVIVFDGLDRIPADWRTVRRLVGSLMRVVLDLRPYRALRPKVLLRPDQFEDEEVFGFVDASKLKADAVRLDWRPIDLYGLLFTQLARSNRSRAAFEEICIGSGIALPPIGDQSPAAIPESLRREAHDQEAVFTRIAGRYMGADHRRGRTYSWIPAHLADARGEISPRSFLRTLGEAAEHSSLTSRTPLDPAGLRSGVRAASGVRLSQLQEDYKWATSALEPLADLKVPCGEKEFIERWQQLGVVETISTNAAVGQYLGPVEFEATGPDKNRLLLQALIRLGVLERRADGRVNMPDIYRVAAQLLRKGGVTPGPRRY
ncbi:hypothetical protein [Pseudoroseomonas sp. WGS1072]|uniref:hypothetical protein n=1 Tax=Roseomonas sp. WGS1072 TaxID=3366816 RepID=UPI003BF2C9F1